jgi:hypothetical protein
MTFLAPWILFGLPLLLVPLLIHLLNRLRFRTRAWAAMAFLLAATRTSSRAARIRHWLVLALRMLAVAAGVLAFARPLVGGWIGGSLVGAPDAVWLVVDRSPSMEALSPFDRGLTLRESAVRQLAEAADALRGVRVSVLDLATRELRAVPDPARLPELDLVGPGDATVPIPQLLHDLARRVVEERPGRVEIWIASDLRHADWQPEHPGWQAARTVFAALPQGLRVRILAMQPASGGGNRSIQVHRLVRAVAPGEAAQLVVDIDRPDAGEETVTLTWNFGGATRQEDVLLTAASTRIARALPPAEDAETAWGSVALPPDENLRDNRAWFVLPNTGLAQAAVVAEPGFAAAALRLAVAPYGAAGPVAARAVAPAETTEQTWEDALLVWAAPAPDAAGQQLLRARIEAGAACVLFPPADGSAGGWIDDFWLAGETATDAPWALAPSPAADGLLGPTAGGEALALEGLRVVRRTVPRLAPGALVDARFEDDAPFVVRRAMGAGLLVQVATRPEPGWSELADGAILVPLIQRVLEQTPALTGSSRMVSAADWTATFGNAPVAPGREGAGDPRIHAGLYRVNDTWVAVNRSAAESLPDRLDPETPATLLDPVPVLVWEADGSAGGSDLAAEAWRLFLFGALLFLLVEGWLLLPRARPRSAAEARTA